MLTDFISVVRELLEIIFPVVRLTRIRKPAEEIDLEPVFYPERGIDRTRYLITAHLTRGLCRVIEKELRGIVIVNAFIESDVRNGIIRIPRKAEPPADLAILIDKELVEREIMRQRMRSGKDARDVGHALGIVLPRVELLFKGYEVLYVSLFLVKSDYLKHFSVTLSF